MVGCEGGERPDSTVVGADAAAPLSTTDLDGRGGLRFLRGVRTSRRIGQGGRQRRDRRMIEEGADRKVDPDLRSDVSHDAASNDSPPSSKKSSSTPT